MKYAFFLILLLSPFAARAQDATDNGDTSSGGGDSALQQLVPAILGTQNPQPTKSLQVTGGSIAGPQAPTPPAVPSIQMGVGAQTSTNIPALNSLIPGLEPPKQDTPPEASAQAATNAPDPKARDADFSALRAGDVGVVVQVIEPTRLRLEDGRIIQLAGIDTADDDPYDPGPISIAARNELKLLLEGQKIRLYVTKDPAYGRISRLGDLLAQVEIPRSGIWVQGALLAAGLARVRPTERNPEMAAQMMKLEDLARNSHRGLWNDPRYAVQTPDGAAQDTNSWAIVEGRVFGAAAERNIIYLNFGPDYRKDFTVGITPAIRRQLESQNIDPQTLTGQVVRVRGWIRDYNGPYMELNNAVWLEVLSENNVHLP